MTPYTYGCDLHDEKRDDWYVASLGEYGWANNGSLAVAAEGREEEEGEKGRQEGSIGRTDASRRVWRECQDRRQHLQPPSEGAAG